MKGNEFWAYVQLGAWAFDIVQVMQDNRLFLCLDVLLGN